MFAGSILSLYEFLLCVSSVMVCSLSHLTNFSDLPTASSETGGAICGAEEFPCGNNTSVCLERKLHCDGVVHCENGEDEERCADIHGSLSALIKDMDKKPVIDINTLPTYNNCSLRHFPSGCTCRYFSWLYCNHLNLTSVPKGLSQEVTKLVFANNSISSLPRSAFLPYTQLKVIQLEGNSIRHLARGAFRGMKNVTFLILMKNSISSLQRGVFEDLDNLEWLLLQQNNLTDFDLEVFTDTPTLHILELTDNRLTLRNRAFPAHENLFWIGLEGNCIEKIGRDTFARLRALEVLILRKNKIYDIDQRAFFNLMKLLELDLSHNSITFLRPRIFLYLRNLSKLNLEHNPITSLPLDLFRSLTNLKSLDLQAIDISNIDLRIFRPLTRLEFIYFKKFHYCSYAPYVRICMPKTDGVSSTEHLLLWPILRMSVWVVALMTCFGNTVVFTWRMLSRKEDRVLSLFIKNLSVADLLMGIYLLAIGAQDVAFRDRYNQYAHAWMSSWQCTTCGIIAMVSSEVSVLILSLITLERYRCIRTNVRVVTITAARYSLVGAWLSGFVIAFFPVLRWSQDFGFYSSNGLCFPLHIDDPYLLGWQYSAFVFLGINFMAVVLIIILYIRMFLIIRHDRQAARPVVMKKHEDVVLALRFFFIVLTDCLCWIPIVLVKIIALCGLKISDNLYACLVVFILPINSALNPVIYTIAAPTELRRRIEKWLERAVLCLHSFECFLLSDPKVAVTSQLTQSLTTTVGRSVSNGSILPTGPRMSTVCSENDTCLINESIEFPEGEESIM